MVNKEKERKKERMIFSPRNHFPRFGILQLIISRLFGIAVAYGNFNLISFEHLI